MDKEQILKHLQKNGFVIMSSELDSETQKYILRSNDFEIFIKFK